MPEFEVHVYKEFSRVVRVDAATPEEAAERYDEATDVDDWEESGDEYASEVVDPATGQTVWSMKARTA